MSSNEVDSTSEVVVDKVAPQPRILDPEFEFRWGADVQETWSKFGWERPSRAQQQNQKAQLNGFGGLRY